jgi:poly-gamma-glutamate synthesis protein (capsule biosynthesis protein)
MPRLRTYPISLALIFLVSISPACAAQLTIAAAGDVCLTGAQYFTYPYSATSYPFSSSYHIFQRADLAFVNLECALTTRTTAMQKRFTFKGHPSFAASLANAGIDAVSLGNNHAADFGRASVVDTMRALARAGVAFSGAGTSAATALRPASLSSKGHRVAFIAATDIIPSGFAATSRLPGVGVARPPTRLLYEVRRADRTHDVVVVMIHWGTERSTEPNSRQRALARALIDAGADVVIGSHPHVWQPCEVYRGRFIAYSLGNFVFFPGNYNGRYTGVLELTVDGTRLTVRVTPFFIGRNGAPMRVSPSHAAGRFVYSVLRKSNLRFVRTSTGFVATVTLSRPLLASSPKVSRAIERARDVAVSCSGIVAAHVK